MPFARKIELRKPEILKKIFELRNAGNGFNNISKIISDGFEVGITHPTAKNLYYEYAAKQKVKKELGEEVDEGWDKAMKEKFERIEKITNSLLDAVETIKSELTPELYLKHAPLIIAILRESLNQLAFIKNQQEQITIKQQNLIYSPLQVMQQISQLEKKKEVIVEIVPEKEKEEKDKEPEEED